MRKDSYLCVTNTHKQIKEVTERISKYFRVVYFFVIHLDAIRLLDAYNGILPNILPSSFQNHSLLSAYFVEWQFIF